MPTGPIYPRPDFERLGQSWHSLNGEWDFAFDDHDVGQTEKWQHNGLPQDLKRKIKVPFVFQTPASGVNNQDAHEVIWYQRSTTGPQWKLEDEKAETTLLRFGAVDYEATVWVNGHLVATHRGGHVPFDADVTAALRNSPIGDRLVTVRVRDSPSDLTQPRGKQYWKPKSESIYYTPSSGIWQSVWLEQVPPTRIADGSGGTTIRSSNIQDGELDAIISINNKGSGKSYNVEIKVSLDGKPVRNSEQVEVPVDKNQAQVKVSTRLDQTQQAALSEDFRKKHPLDDDASWRNGVALWSPEHPSLYDLVIVLRDASGNVLDEVSTYAGMRSLSWSDGDGTFRLNGRPHFHALVLDQGYWPATNMTPPDADSLRADIELTKAMGFDGCRKHQKVEDPLFLWWADRLGFMVWGEMASAFAFGGECAARFDEEWAAAVRRDVNHPCIVAWTPANESWGYPDLDASRAQRDHLRSLYYATRTIDPTRPVNDNCGWQHVQTDLSTFHEYADGPRLEEMCASLDAIFHSRGGPPVFVPATADDPGAAHKPGAPVICTEFGGVNIEPAAADAKRDGDWGYTTASDPADLLRRFERLCLAVVRAGHCCGFVYTQLTDIEQEVNGLYTFDRVPKLEPAKAHAVIDEARRIYYSGLPQGAGK